MADLSAGLLAEVKYLIGALIGYSIPSGSAVPVICFHPFHQRLQVRNTTVRVCSLDAVNGFLSSNRLHSPLPRDTAHDAFVSYW